MKWLGIIILIGIGSAAFNDPAKSTMEFLTIIGYIVWVFFVIEEIRNDIHKKNRRF